MKVYVVMGNDFPDAVFGTIAEADRYVEEKRAEPDSRNSLGTPRIHWRFYEFDVKVQPEASRSYPFLALARRFGLDYGTVLALADARRKLMAIEAAARGGRNVLDATAWIHPSGFDVWESEAWMVAHRHPESSRLLQETDGLVRDMMVVKGELRA